MGAWTEQFLKYKSNIGGNVYAKTLLIILSLAKFVTLLVLSSPNNQNYIPYKKVYFRFRFCLQI